MRGTKMEYVSFVILHYKDYHVTETCVSSILNMDQQERIRIVIVDNDIQKKEEERQELLLKYQADPRIKVLLIKENGGFSYANNQGYRYAREKFGAGFILVLNNDIEFPQKDFIARLEECYQKNPCHVLGPDVIRQGTGEHQNPMDKRIRTRDEARYTIRMNRLALRFYPILYPYVYHTLKKAEKNRQKDQDKLEQWKKSVQKDIVPFGACLIFTPEFVRNEAKAFTPETQFFYEEYLLTLRCQRKGYHIVYDPSMTVYHESGAATKKTYSSEKKRIRFMMERTAEACEVYLGELGE